VSKPDSCPYCGCAPTAAGAAAKPSAPARELDPLYREVHRIREIAEARIADDAERRIADLNRQVAELRATVARLRGQGFAARGVAPGGVAGRRVSGPAAPVS
jgi:hypothetical protein